MNTLYRPALWALIGAALVVGYLTQMSKVEIGLLVTWMVVVRPAFEIDKLRDASGKSVRDKYAKIIKQIEEGEVVEPKHNPPARYIGFKPYEPMFHDFAGFANKVNHDLQWGGWRLQEAGGEGVRNYSILYNGVKVGGLKLDPWSMPYKTADSEISASIEIWHAKLFQHGSLRSFLRTPIAAICADTHANFDRAGVEMDRALDDYLWNAVRSPDAIPRFTMLIHGRPLAYFDQGEVREENKRLWADLEAKLGQTTDGQSPAVQ